jgi:molybdate transport repressor ModE-like protein
MKDLTSPRRKLRGVYSVPSALLFPIFALGLPHHHEKRFGLGPGKIELLQAIEHTGSISAAGRQMGMSYRRACLLVDALNRMFNRVLIRTSSGGVRGGGAQVTDFGRAVAAAYRRAEKRAFGVIQEEFAAIDGPIDERHPKSEKRTRGRKKSNASI